MNTSLKLKEALVPGLNVNAQEYTDAMILSGSKVEFYKKMDADLEKIVVGQIKKIEPHPDADKLIICQVDVGTGEDIQIVTGAPNVKEGDKVILIMTSCPDLVYILLALNKIGAVANMINPLFTQEQIRDRINDTN